MRYSVLSILLNTTAVRKTWGLGFAARHQTTPGTNIVVVFTRNPAVHVYGIGRHIGKGNGHYRILRWYGSHFRVNR